MEGLLPAHHMGKQQRLTGHKTAGNSQHLVSKQNQVGTVILYGVPIVSLVIEAQERLCLAQISNTLLKQFSYNEIHNRRVALGITCVQCTPVQLEILRRAGAMPVSSRRCGMITRREAERLCKSFLGDNAPPRLPDDFAFSVHHECAWGCRGAFLPSRYNSSRAKCIKCTLCGLFFSPNKFIFHSHRTSPTSAYVQPDAANFNSWRRHMKLSGNPPESIVYSWEDVKAMFNGGTRKRMMSSTNHHRSSQMSSESSQPNALSSPPPSKQIKIDSPPSTPISYPPPTPTPRPVPHRVPPFPELPISMSMIDYVWNGLETAKQPFFSPYLPWFGTAKRSILGFSSMSPMVPQQDTILQQMTPLSHSGKLYHQSAFRPVYPTLNHPDENKKRLLDNKKQMHGHSTKNDHPISEDSQCDEIDVGKCEDDETSDRSAELKCEQNEDSSDSVGSLTQSSDVPRNYKTCIKVCHNEADYFPSDVSKGRQLLERISVCSRVAKSKYPWDRAEEERAEDYSTKNRMIIGDDADGVVLPVAEERGEQDDDETVDIETTDDHIVNEDASKGDEGQVVQAEKVRAARKNSSPQSLLVSDKLASSPVSQKHRIWTIARFSLEEPPRYPYSDVSPEDMSCCEPEGAIQDGSNGEAPPHSPKLSYRTSCTTLLT